LKIEDLDRARPVASPRDTVTLPADQAEVFTAIREKAKTGNPQAVREYREWLSRLTLTTEEQAQNNALNKRLEDMTPDELAFADAWAERQIARAQRKLTGIRKAEEQVTQRAAAQTDS
jgi:hypothetical protein